MTDRRTRPPASPQAITPDISIAAVAGSIAFFIAAPMTVAGMIPYLISGWRFEPPLLGWGAGRVVGAVLIGAGLPVLIDSFVRFALHRGTPAPIAPTETLVVSGLYRYARNPMYIAILWLNAGQALLFGNVRLLGYAGLAWLLMHTFVVLYEEPALRARFGRSYEVYRANVPRWLPRLRPWRGTGSSG